MLTRNLISRLKQYFATKKNNRFSLTDDDPLDNNLKTVTIGNERTPLNLSKNDIKLICDYLIINGYVKLSGDLELGSNATSAIIKSPELNINSDADLNINVGGQDIYFRYNDTTLFQWNAITGMTLKSASDVGDYFSITCGTSGATTMITHDNSGSAAADIVMNPNGEIHFNKATGFTQFEPTYNATDTNVNFNDHGNKAFVTFGGNITDMNLYFPNASCNCVLLLKQDGTGSRTVSNWKTFDQADGNESTVVWAGGSAPTLTTTANKLDILSFYWDNDNHKAYGVASLNF